LVLKKIQSRGINTFLGESKMIKKVLFLLPFLFLSCSACGGRSEKAAPSVVRDHTATLTWAAPTKKVDGTTLSNLAGYKIYYGQSSYSYTGTITLPISSALCKITGGINECTYTVEGLSSGVYYFAVTAYDTAGNESDYSNERSKTID
jgi:hypothetical protein